MVPVAITRSTGFTAAATSVAGVASADGSSMSVSTMPPAAARVRARMSAPAFRPPVGGGGRIHRRSGAPAPQESENDRGHHRM